MTTRSDPDRALEENIGIMAKPIIRRCNSPADVAPASQRDSKTIVPAPRKFADGGFQRPGSLIPDQSYPDHYHPPDL
jgi:hypothetical protein